MSATDADLRCIGGPLHGQFVKRQGRVLHHQRRPNTLPRIDEKGSWRTEVLTLPKPDRYELWIAEGRPVYRHSEVTDAEFEQFARWLPYIGQHWVQKYSGRILRVSEVLEAGARFEIVVGITNLPTFLTSEADYRWRASNEELRKEYRPITADQVPDEIYRAESRHLFGPRR